MTSMNKRSPDLVRIAAILAIAAGVMAIPVLGFAQTAQEQRQDQLNRDLESKRLQRSQDGRHCASGCARWAANRCLW